MNIYHDSTFDSVRFKQCFINITDSGCINYFTYISCLRKIALWPEQKNPGQLGVTSPPGRSLRNRLPIDYSRLNDGNFDHYKGYDFDSKPDLYTDTHRELSDKDDRNQWGVSNMK